VEGVMDLTHAVTWLEALYNEAHFIIQTDPAPESEAGMRLAFLVMAIQHYERAAGFCKQLDEIEDDLAEEAREA
jgi:hypothetical protein